MIYSAFARGIRRMVRAMAFRRAMGPTYADCAVDSPKEARLQGEKSRPAVYVVHHQNLKGPVSAAVLLPFEVRIWVFHVFCDRKACFQQYYGYTFTKRFRWPKAVAWMAAAMLSRLVPAFLNSFGVIPVYRESRRIRKTMELSLQALRRGESILICPDRDYASGSEEMGEIYRGFLYIEKYYYKETGEHLDFIPLAVRKSPSKLETKKTLELVAGKPVRFSGTRPFATEQKLAACQLAEEINRLGCNSDTDVSRRRCAMETDALPRG